MKKIAIFDEELDIRISKDDTFRVYISRPEEEKEKRMGSSLIFLMHGGGASSYTWAPIVSGLRKHAYVAAFDARGHGHSISSNEANISVEVLIQDAMNVLERIVRYVKEDAKSEEKVSVAMVGHSFGGAIAAKVTAKFTSSKSMELKCLVLIDICEGTAMNSLGHTKVFLQRRPSHFRTEQDAVNWSLNKGTLRNRSSAAMSVPDTLVHEKTYVSPISSNLLLRFCLFFSLHHSYSHTHTHTHTQHGVAVR